MKIKGVRVSQRKIGPVEPRQSGARPVAAPEVRAPEVEKRGAARSEPESLRREQGLRPRQQPEKRRQYPEQRRLVVREEVDAAFHRGHVAIAVRQIPHRVRKNAQVIAMALERPVAQQGNPEKQRADDGGCAPERARRRTLERVEPGPGELHAPAEKKARFPGLARPAPYRRGDEGHDGNRASPMRQFPGRARKEIKPLVFKRPMAREQNRKKERSQHSRSTPKQARPAPHRRGD